MVLPCFHATTFAVFGEEFEEKCDVLAKTQQTFPTPDV